MKSTLSKLVIFAAGAAIGSAVTWKFLDKKYKHISREEIDSVKEYYANKYAESKDEESESKRYLEEVAKPFAEGFQTGLNSILQDQGYVSYSEGANAANKSEKEEQTTRPYIIAPEQFGELDGYSTCSLTYYLDKVLADDYDEIVDDADEIVGLDSLTRFGEYEDDSVFVRNDERKCDYEILLDPRKFIDVAGNSPHRAEDEWDEMS